MSKLTIEQIIKDAHTGTLIRWRNQLYTQDGDWDGKQLIYDFNHDRTTYRLPHSLIMNELNTREHLPSAAERKQKRIDKAKEQRSR